MRFSPQQWLNQIAGSDDETSLLSNATLVLTLISPYALNANVATYADPGRSLAPDVIATTASFLKKCRADA